VSDGGSVPRFPSLGIIGGMGHVSTIDYYSRIIRLFQARKAAVRNEDYPRVCIQGIADADNVETLADGDLREKLAVATELLTESEVDVIGVPCNTVHNLIPSIAARVKIPFLDIVDATTRKLDSEHPARCAILATRRTISNNIYGARSNAEQSRYLNLTQDDQNIVDSLILRVNAGDSVAALNSQIEQIITKLPSDIAILLACTELSGLAPYLRSRGRLVIDSLEELVTVTYVAISKEQLT
jgi:aspartate racemase